MLNKHQISLAPQSDQKMNFEPIMALKCIRNEKNIRIHHRSENKNAFKLSRAQYMLFSFFSYFKFLKYLLRNNLQNNEYCFLVEVQNVCYISAIALY